MGRVAVPVSGTVGVDVWILEQAELELGAEDTRYGGVDHGVGDDAAAKRVEIRAVLLERRLEDDVESGLERVLRGGRGVGLRPVENRGPAGRGRVGDHKSPKSPGAFERVGEQPAILRRGHAVHGVVRRHDRARSRLLDGHLKRWKVDLLAQALAVLNGITVASSVADVRHEMFWRGHNSSALECRTECTPHERGEVQLSTPGGLQRFERRAEPARVESPDHAVHEADGTLLF